MELGLRQDAYQWVVCKKTGRKRTPKHSPWVPLTYHPRLELALISAQDLLLKKAVDEREVPLVQAIDRLREELRASHAQIEKLATEAQGLK